MAAGIKRTINWFIEQSNIKHNNKFDYSLSEYTNTHTKLKIICPIHGEFEQRPMDHIKGRGCYACSGKQQNDPCEFLKDMKEIHVNNGTPNYDYSKVSYKNLYTKINIICPNHGSFWITPKSILHQRSGCSTCGLDRAGVNRRTTQDDFIKQATKLHNGKYLYHNIEYTTSYDKINITCPIHGVFSQTPTNHIHSKRGCPECGNVLKGGLGGYTNEYFINNPDQQHIPAIIYATSIQNGNERFIKIGITAKSTKHRFNRGEYNHMKIELLYEKNLLLYEAFRVEQQFIDSMKDYRFFPNTKFSGYTECFRPTPEVKNMIQSIFQL